MSTVFDVKEVVVNDGSPLMTSTVASPSVVTIVEPTVQVVDITPVMTEQPIVQVIGPQGPPGLQNVYVGNTDPSSGWGPEQTGYVWIKT